MEGFAIEGRNLDLAADVQFFEWLDFFKRDVLVLVTIDSRGNLSFYQFLKDAAKATLRLMDGAEDLQPDKLRGGRLSFPSLTQSQICEATVTVLPFEYFLALLHSKRASVPVEAQGFAMLGRGRTEDTLVFVLDFTVAVASLAMSEDRMEFQLQRRFNLLAGLREEKELASTYAHLVIEKGWLFALKPSGQIDVWDTATGMKLSSIDIPLLPYAHSSFGLHPKESALSASISLPSSAPTTPREDFPSTFERLAISRDLLWLATTDVVGAAVVISLDSYFALHAPSLKNVGSVVEYVPTGRLSMGLPSPTLLKTSIASVQYAPTHGHWFDTDIHTLVQTATLPALMSNLASAKGEIPWRNRPPLTMPAEDIDTGINGFTVFHVAKPPPSRSLSLSSLPLPPDTKDDSPTYTTDNAIPYSPLRPLHSSEVTPPYLMTSPVAPHLPLSQLGYYLLPPACPQGKILDLVLAPSSVVCRFAVSDFSHPITLAYPHPACSNRELHGTWFRINDASLLLSFEDGSWNYLTKDGLRALIMGHSQEQLLHNLIMFESTPLADRLCSLNKWDNRSLHMHALELGIKYRQLSVIESALQSLDHEQQLIGSQMLLSYLESCSTSTDRDFVRSLLHIGMTYVGSLIKELSAVVGEGKIWKYLSDSSGNILVKEDARDDNIHDSVIENLVQFSNILESLRECQMLYLNGTLSGKEWVDATEKQKKPKPRQLFSSPREVGSSSQSKLNSGSKLMETLDPEDSDYALFSLETAQRWNAMATADIVRDALLSGTLCTAVAYLRYRGCGKSSSQDLKNPLSKTANNSIIIRQGGEGTSADEGISRYETPRGDLFGDIRDISHALAYQAVCQDQVDLAVRILRAIGNRHIALHLRQIATLTCRSSIRARLLSLLEAESSSGFGLELETEPRPYPINPSLLAYMRQIERLYPNPYYSLERIKRLSSSHRTMQHLPFTFREVGENKSLEKGLWRNGYDDLDDLLPSTASLYGFQLVANLSSEGGSKSVTGDEGSIPIHPLTDSSYWLLGEESPHAGYAQLSIASVASWSQVTRVRVLLEKEVDPFGSLSLPLTPPVSLPTALTYLTSHVHLSCLLRTAHMICRSYPSLRPELLRSLASSLPLANEFVKRAVFAALGDWGLFIGAGSSEGSAHWFTALLPQLCSVHSLYTPRPSSADQQAEEKDSELRMDARLLPKGVSSPFHQQFIKWCMDKELSSLLLNYLSCHQLGFTSGEMKELLLGPLPRSWPAMLFMLRLQENLAEAALTNTSLCLKKKSARMQDLVDSLQSIGVIVSLATLSYGRIPIRKVLDNDGDEAWRLDLQSVLRHIADSFPSLREALSSSRGLHRDGAERKQQSAPEELDSTPQGNYYYYRNLHHSGDIPSAVGDVTLLELLQGGFPVDVIAVTACNEEEEDMDQSHPKTSPGSSLQADKLREGRALPAWGHNEEEQYASLTDTKQSAGAITRSSAETSGNQNQATIKGSRTAGGIDVWYYLVAVRPFHAFHLLMRSGVAQAMPPPTHAPHLQMLLPAAPPSLLSRPLHHRTQPSLTPGEIAYFQRYARLVALEHVQNVAISSACCCFLQQIGLDSQLLLLDAEAARRILSFHPSPPPTSQLVRMFVEFSSSPVTSNRSEASAARLLLEEATIRMIEKGQPDNVWEVVYMFSRTHGLGLPTWHLERLASNGDWVGFLHEAAAEGFAADELLGAISQFKDHHLRGHIYVILSPLLSKPTLNEAALVERNASLWDILLPALSSPRPSIKLLQNALAYGRPLLAVVAACFDDIDTLQPMLIWLLASISSLPEDNKHENMLSGIVSTEPSLWDKDKLSIVVCRLCALGHHLLVQKCFLLFDPSSGFVEYLLFHQAFLQRRFSDCGAHLKRFASCADSLISMGGVVDIEWQKRTAIQLLDSLLWTASSGYEQGILLQAAHNAELSQQYTRLHHVFQLLARTGLGRDQLAASPEVILDLLLKNAHFNEARVFAVDSSMDERLDEISLYEVQHILSRARSACLWTVEQERVNVWKQISTTFGRTACRSEKAGQFFLEQVGREGAIQTAREQLLLMTFAQECFAKAGSEVTASLGVDMTDLENRILLLSVSTEAATLQNMPPASPSASMSAMAGHQNQSPIFSELPSVASFSPHVLLQIVNRLLQNGDLDKAERICQHFKVENREVQILRYMNALAEGKIEAADVPTWAFADVGNESRGAALEQLLSKVEHAVEYAGGLVVRYKVAQRLSLPLSEVMSRDPYQVLLFLLMHGKDLFPLTDAFIQYNHLNYTKVAIHTAESYYKALQGQHEQQTSATAIDPNWPDEDFAQFANLSKAPKEVGNRLVYLLSRAKDGMPSPMEVELLVRSHFCFRLACSLSGCEMVQHLVKERLPAYIRNRQFRLLLRLLTGMKAYNELTYIFDALLQNEQFEIMLGKIPGLQHNSVDQMEFRLALHRYLVTHHPQDTEKLTMMFLAFNMHRDMGQFLKRQAQELLDSVKIQPSGSQAYQKLVKAMGLFLDAADNFVKDRSFNTGNQCLATASLISLQVELGDTLVIGLDSSGARKVMTTITSFPSALIVARAYNLHTISEWISPLYQQVIIGNNFTYLEDFLQVIPPSAPLYLEMAQKFQADTSKSNRAAAFKRFLKTCTDSFLLFDIAKELSLDDLFADVPGEIQQWKNNRK